MKTGKMNGCKHQTDVNGASDDCDALRGLISREKIERENHTLRLSCLYEWMEENTRQTVDWWWGIRWLCDALRGLIGGSRETRMRRRWDAKTDVEIGGQNVIDTDKNVLLEIIWIEFWPWCARRSGWSCFSCPSFSSVQNSCKSNQVNIAFNSFQMKLT